jgi:hypothetical protein
MSASNLSDENLLRYYDSIRKQVDADRGSKYKFVSGDAAIKEYAETIRLELYRRRVPFTPIDWWTDQQSDPITPAKADARDRLTEATSTEPIEKTAAEPSEARPIGDPGEFDDVSKYLKSSIDALMKKPNRSSD